MALGPETRNKHHLDCDPETAAAQFPVFWEEWAAGKRLTLADLGRHTHFPAFAIREVIGPAGNEWVPDTRAEVFFRREGSDDPGCFIEIRELGKGFWSHYGPPEYDAISPGTILGIADRFAAWLASTVPEKPIACDNGASISGDAKTKQPPRVPVKRKNLQTWKATWRAIKGQWDSGMTDYIALCVWLDDHHSKLHCCPETLSDIIKAGAEGKLD